MVEKALLRAVHGTDLLALAAAGAVLDVLQKIYELVLLGKGALAKILQQLVEGEGVGEEL
jgi:hypothetical protein